MDRKDILNLIKQKSLDYRPDNVSIFMETSFPNSVVINKKGDKYIVYLTTARNEVGSEIHTFKEEQSAIDFFLAKVEEEKMVADKYAKVGLTWPPSPI